MLSTERSSPTPMAKLKLPPGAREGKGGTALSPAWPAHTPSASSSEKPLPGRADHRPDAQANAHQGPGARSKEIQKSVLQQRGLDMDQFWL